MDVWIIINPILKTVLYLASFGSIGSFIFSLHFRLKLTEEQQFYCVQLSRKSALIGIITSVLLIFSVAGNLGGDFVSVIDILMLQLAIQSKSGISYLTVFAGFIIMLLAHKMKAKAQKKTLLIGSVTVLFSFTLAGHAQLSGVFTQLLLILHLLGIAFWLGALLPFRWICLQSDVSNLSSLAHRFGVIAMVYVGLLLITGITYAYTLLGKLSHIFTTSYGNALLVKIVLVISLLCLAAFNKFKAVPALEKNPLQGLKQFKSSVQFEIVLALFILSASSLLTTSLTVPMGM
ncbi:MAG: CopD family protein [Paracoccaceae bacterium]|nr:CopD family protein [Paracoccaceae bacterium]